MFIEKVGMQGAPPLPGVWECPPNIFFLLLVSPQAKRVKEGQERKRPPKKAST